jgi:hypothetical protein
MSRLTLSGWRWTNISAMLPPIDHPSTSGLPSPSASMSPAVSSAIFAMVRPRTGDGNDVAMPRLSKSTTVCWVARSAISAGSHSAIVPEKPMIITRGGPVPTVRYPRLAPFTSTC